MLRVLTRYTYTPPAHPGTVSLTPISLQELYNIEPIEGSVCKEGKCKEKRRGDWVSVRVGGESEGKGSLYKYGRRENRS